MATTHINEHDARELDLYAKHTREMIAPTKAVVAHLQRLVRAGRFDAKKSIASWARLYDVAAKRYAKEYAHPSDWNRMFPKSLRMHLAGQRAEDEAYNLMSGNYGSL